MHLSEAPFFVFRAFGVKYYQQSIFYLWGGIRWRKTAPEEYACIRKYPVKEYYLTKCEIFLIYR